jgi:hypothetical protein
MAVYKQLRTRIIYSGLRCFTLSVYILVLINVDGPNNINYYKKKKKQILLTYPKLLVRSH